MSKAPLLAVLVPLLGSIAHAGPVAIAKCGDSVLDVTVGSQPGTGTLHGVIASGAARWTFTGNVSLARLGAKTRTLAVENLEPAEKKKPVGLVLDLLLDDKKLLLRHASEGDPDVAYALDLDKCSFDNDAAIVALVPPSSEAGCAPALIKNTYRKQVTQVATLPDAEADHEAQLLCDDHQKTLAARAQLEAAISDRAAKDRIAARGPALLKIEDNRMKAWNRIDACLGADPTKAHGVAALHEGEARERACYAKIAARP